MLSKILTLLILLATLVELPCSLSAQTKSEKSTIVRYRPPADPSMRMNPDMNISVTRSELEDQYDLRIDFTVPPLVEANLITIYGYRMLAGERANAPEIPSMQGKWKSGDRVTIQITVQKRFADPAQGWDYRFCVGSVSSCYPSPNLLTGAPPPTMTAHTTSSPTAASIAGDWVCSDQSLYHGAKDTSDLQDFMWRLNADGTIHSIGVDGSQHVHRWRQTGSGVEMEWELFSFVLADPSQKSLTFSQPTPTQLSTDYMVTGSRGGEWFKGRVTCAKGDWKTADVGRRWRFFNRGTRDIRIYIHDGEATATGSSCDTNRSIVDGRVLRPGEDLVELCHGRDGFCARFADREEWPPNLSPWIGAACKGQEPTWRRANYIQEIGLP